MSLPLDQTLTAVLDDIVERVAVRAADLVVERLRDEGWSPTQPAEEQLLDVQRVAQRLAVSRNAVYKLAASGKLATVKVGGRLRVRLADVESFVHDNVRSDERVRELARAAQGETGGTRPSAAVKPTVQSKTTRTPRRRPRRADGAVVPAASETGLRVLKNNDADAPKTRRSG